MLDGLGTNATLTNASGTTSCALPTGRPFIVSDRTSLAPRASVTFQLHFANPTKAAIIYTPAVLAGVDAR